MNTHNLALLVLFALIVLACYQLRANDGIAKHAMGQQITATNAAPEVSTTPPTAASEKSLKKDDAIKTQPRVSSVRLRPMETTPAGIKASGGTPIHPVVEDAGANQPPQHHVSTQEDYHISQAN